MSSIDALDHRRQHRHEAGRGRSAGSAGSTTGQTAGAAGMGKKSNSTSQLSAAGKSRALELSCAKKINNLCT